jgi:succinate-semialdehyde dehydrogenase/glutarate-semialdehyde dehydrogenase
VKITSINPSTNKKLGEVTASTKSEIIEAVKKARKAKNKWKNLGVDGRNKVLESFYSVVEEKHEYLAELQAKEMGMPISQAKEDVEFGIAYLRWYSEHAEKLLAPEVTVDEDDQIHTVYREPLGVAGVIVPWNFPMSNFVWQTGQNLVAGNTIVFKHSEEVAMFAEELKNYVDQSDLPEGVLNIIQGDGSVGKILMEQDLDLICFTGSTKVGQLLYKKAAEKFIPAVMELGGSAPGIVFEDADIAKVVESVMFNRYGNCGQICDGLKRLIVHSSKVGDVTKALKDKLESMVVGEASDEKTELGPLVSKRQVEALEKQVDISVKLGAKIVTGGKRLKDLDGAFYMPTLLTNVTKEMTVWNEEVFGPVLPIVTFETVAEAVELANDTEYGLGGYLYTEDKDLFDRVASKLETGMVGHNTVSYLRECNPFGGFKKSGIGREHGKYGFDDVTQIKVVAREK